MFGKNDQVLDIDDAIPPGRLEQKSSDRPSADISGSTSQLALLFVGSRFTGSDQGPSIVGRDVSHRS